MQLKKMHKEVEGHKVAKILTSVWLRQMNIYYKARNLFMHHLLEKKISKLWVVLKSLMFQINKIKSKIKN